MLSLGVNTNNECGNSQEEILKNIKNAGFESVMVAFKTGNGEEIVKLANNLCLKIPYAHLSTSDNFWVKGYTNTTFMETLKQEIRICSKHNIKIAVLHATSGQPNVLPLGPNTHGLECIREIVDFAKGQGVKIALENLDNSSFKHFEYVIENIKDENLGFCYDAGHHQLYNKDVDLLGKYGDRILAVHLHSNFMDWSYGDDWSKDRHFLPFDGKIDYENIIKKLARKPYKNVIMLELHKKSLIEPKYYENITDLDYLIEAKKQAQKLAEMLQNERAKN